MKTGCAACDDPDGGHMHTCSGSGTFRAAEAYAADELVYHGGFHRATLEAIFGGARAVAADPGFGGLPTLWIHGEGDVLAPLEATTEAMRHLRGSNIQQHVYPGAQHEVLNEINKEEVLDDVARFLRGALGLRPSS